MNLQKYVNLMVKNFSLMVSLDGYRTTHDKIRGRKGNFDSAVEVIKYFKENTNIPITIGCTITKDNLWEVDYLFDYLQENNIYGRFRIGEFIKRLYNKKSDSGNKVFLMKMKAIIWLYFLKN